MDGLEKIIVVFLPKTSACVFKAPAQHIDCLFVITFDRLELEELLIELCDFLIHANMLCKIGAGHVQFALYGHELIVFGDKAF